MRLWTISKSVTTLLTLLTIVSCKTIDNRLIDVPSVKCGPDEIRITGRSEELFEGQIFVKRHRRDIDCHVVYSEDANSTTPTFAIPLDKISACGIEMKRTPGTRSLELQAVIAIAFHPEFITAGDRAFAVHCLFQQSQMTVAANLDFISDIATRAILEGSAARPELSLRIVPAAGAAANSSATAANAKASGRDEVPRIRVGQAYMVVWEMQQPAPALYGMRVLGCSAQSADGRAIRIIDNGCSLDRSLVSDVRFSEDENRAFSDVQAFKFPDSDDLILQCAVKFCIRRFEHLVIAGSTDTSELCAQLPECSRQSPNMTAKARRRRDTVLEEDPNAVLLSGRLVLLDEYGRRYGLSPEALRAESPLVDPSSIEFFASGEWCLSPPIAALLSSSFLLILSVTILFASCYAYSSWRWHIEMSMDSDRA